MLVSVGWVAYVWLFGCLVMVACLVYCWFGLEMVYLFVCGVDSCLLGCFGCLVYWRVGVLGCLVMYLVWLFGVVIL